MEVRISLDQTDPPVGSLTVTSPSRVQEGTRSPIAFTGWLGLLHALSEALDSSGGSSGGSPGGSPGGSSEAVSSGPQDRNDR
jgi:hypothetical protein